MPCSVLDGDLALLDIDPGKCRYARLLPEYSRVYSILRVYPGQVYH